MEVLEISTPNSFHTSDGNVKKIGFDRQIIYIAHNSRTKLEIWKLNCLIPNSWQRVYYKNFKELSYSYFSFSKIDMSIYALLVAVFVSLKFAKNLSEAYSTRQNYSLTHFLNFLP